MRAMTALLAALALGSVAAQSTATPRATSPGLIFDLLGTVNTVEVSLSEEVRHVFVIAVRERDVVLRADREATADTASVAITAGALNQAVDCPLLLFANLEFLRHDGSGHSGNRATMCLPLEETGADRTHWSPLATFRDSLDLPPDTWLAVETVGVPTRSSTVESDAIGSDVVFYLRLSTTEGNTLPEPPAYETWGELRAAFR